MITVRRASADEAGAIAAVHCASWRVAYAHLGETFLASIDEAERTELWDKVLADPDEHGVVLVACDEGRVVAFANLRRSRDVTQPDNVGEVVAIYAHPDAWGIGAGRALMEAAVAELSALGFAEAMLWVLDDNDRARRFYEVAGWRPDGGELDEVWRGAAVKEVRYRRSLG